MFETFHQEIIQRTSSLKTAFKELLELVENWILSHETDQEMHDRLSRVLMIIGKPNSGLNPEDIKVCQEHLNFLLGRVEKPAPSSTAFRKKLNWLFQEQIEKLNDEFNLLKKTCDGIRDILNDETVPASGFIMAQEDERKRISREIHDGPAQSLANLTMRIDFCLEQIGNPDVLKKELSDLKDSVTKSLRDIRRFIFDLRPMALDDLGLIPTIEQFLAGIKARTGFVVQFQVDGERIPLSSEKELAVFRVIQEAVNNAIHHSKGKNIQIFLSFDKNLNTLTGVVKDDGIGFDIGQIKKTYGISKRLGLKSMEERVNLAGGKLKIVSDKGEGTVVSFSIKI